MSPTAPSAENFKKVIKNVSQLVKISHDYMNETILVNFPRSIFLKISL